MERVASVWAKFGQIWPWRPNFLRAIGAGFFTVGMIIWQEALQNLNAPLASALATVLTMTSTLFAAACLLHLPVSAALEGRTAGTGDRPASLAAAGIMSFLLSFGGVIVTSFLTTTRMMTLPVRMYAEANFSLEPTVHAVSALMILATILSLFILNRLVRLGRPYAR